MKPADYVCIILFDRYPNILGLFYYSPTLFLEFAPGITVTLAAVLICCALMAVFRL